MGVRSMITGLCGGARFGIMESILYFVSAVDLLLLTLRSITTPPLHMVNTSLPGCFVSRDGPPCMINGFVIAILLHIIFNSIASDSVLFDSLSPMYGEHPLLPYRYLY